MRVTALVLAAGLAAAQPALAGEPADSIEAVISDQIAAFGSEALGRAFSHASPDIQDKFGDPQTFGRMVESGYPMIWRPAGWEWGELRQTGRGWVQTVIVQDAEGRFHAADYLMEEIDGRWRIDGVFLRRMPGVAS